MIHAALSDIAKQVGAAIPSQDIDFTGISIDTRHMLPNSLYVAIRGETFDGHQFVGDAAQKGAVAALVNRQIDCDIPQIIVTDTLLALGTLAKNWRDRFSLPLIAVTGSNGKTTLKNMIASIFSAACHNQQQFVLATEGNFNNNIGLPLTLARLHEQHRYGVLEMGMNHFGEIEYLTKLARPTIAVINNAAEAHLEGLGDVAGVAKAKGEIFLNLPPAGIAVLNRDDPHFDYWRGLIGNHRYLAFGLENAADISATYHENQPLVIQTPQGEITLTLPLLGKHNARNALAATAATMAANIDLAYIKMGLENVKPAPGRMRQYALANQVKIIDDTYNANPFSLEAAVNTLRTFPGTKIVVLGDMKELGKDAKELHYTAGEKMREAGINYLFTLGQLSEETAKAFGHDAVHFMERNDLIATLLPYLKKDVTVLVKGSRSMQMEKILANIIPANERDHSH